MKLIEFYEDKDEARVQAEYSEIKDYLENMSLVQQKMAEFRKGTLSKPLSSYLLKRDIELADGTILENAWCCSLRLLTDEIYEAVFSFDSKETK